MKKPDPHQDELPLSATRAHAVFPGRTNLYVQEVAKELGVSIHHVLNLIREGELHAVNVAGRNTNLSGRNAWRIPVSSWDEFITRRHNAAELPLPNKPTK